jgi:cell division septum initiation protein DivIVA
MKKSFMLLLSVVVLISISIFAAETDTSTEKDEITQLKEKIEALEERVAELEEKLEEKQPNIILKQKNTPQLPNLLPPSHDVLPSWEQKEFNGMSYYIAPIREQRVIKDTIITIK